MTYQNYQAKDSRVDVAVVENNQGHVSLKATKELRLPKVATPVDKEFLRGLVIEDGMELPNYARFVLLVPDRDVDEAQLGRKIIGIASKSTPSKILLFAYVSKNSREPATSRRLATIAAFLQNDFQNIETRVIRSGNWLDALIDTREQGDLIACPKGLTQQMLFQPVALEEALIQTFYSPVYVFGDLYPREAKPAWKYLQPVIYWLGMVAIFAGFFAVEAEILRMAIGSSNLFMVIAFILEIAFIWGWSSIQGAWGE